MIMRGQKAIEVDQPLIDLLTLSIERNKTISSKVNVAFGSVINIWHDYRDKAEANGGIGEVPDNEELEKANLHTSIDSIQIDEKQKTVYIDDPEVSIDVGATAKGYAIELIKDGLIEKGVDNFLLSGGGNVATMVKEKFKKKVIFILMNVPINSASVLNHLKMVIMQQVWMILTVKMKLF